MNSYVKMINLLDKIHESPLAQPHESTHRLSKAMSLSATSGYRHISSAESYGFLKRDADGLYGIGEKQIQIGLAASGFGILASFLPSILMHIRKGTRRTAFFAPMIDDQLLTGPFSMGRGTEFKAPSKRYQVKSTLLQQEGQAALLTLKDCDNPRIFQSAIALEILNNSTQSAMLGFLTQSDHDLNDPRLLQILEKAHALLQDATPEDT